MVLGQEDLPKSVSTVVALATIFRSVRRERSEERRDEMSKKGAKSDTSAVEELQIQSRTYKAWRGRLK